MPQTRVIDEAISYSKESQKCYCRAMKFSLITKVHHNDATRMQKDTESTKSLGLIQVSIERRFVKGLVKPVSNFPVDTAVLEVAEKALKGKAISHATSFGETKPMKSDYMVETQRIAADTGPIAVFRFMYRSREDLKQQLIIPRTPSPELATPAAQHSFHNMAMVELLRLAQERLDQMKQKEDVKSHFKSNVGVKGKREIQEVIDVDEEADEARAAKRPQLTIDLTD
ncbi:hypothetical protein F5B17DRAFT_389457, partial [Nemania serpens]